MTSTHQTLFLNVMNQIPPKQFFLLKNIIRHDLLTRQFSIALSIYTQISMRFKHILYFSKYIEILFVIQLKSDDFSKFHNLNWWSCATCWFFYILTVKIFQWDLISFKLVHQESKRVQEINLLMDQLRCFCLDLIFQKSGNTNLIFVFREKVIFYYKIS